MYNTCIYKDLQNCCKLAQCGHDARQRIRESVDSLCRDDADMPMPPYIGKACNRPNAAFVSLFR